MKALNCRLGDLAVIVRAELLENIGTIVYIVGSHGQAGWSGFRGKTHLWQVEVAVQEARLVYEEPDGSRRFATHGLAPDAILKPIAPAWTAEWLSTVLGEHSHV